MTAVAPAVWARRDTSPAETGLDVDRDVHKGLRAELFVITTALGRVEPGDVTAIEAVAGRQRRLLELLEVHGRVEDDVVGPVLLDVAPLLHDAVVVEHEALGAASAEVAELAAAALASAGDAAAVLRRWYLATASHTAAHLAHQATEELAVTPALVEAMGEAQVEALERRVLGAMPPERVAAYLRLALPAANPLERAALVAAVRSGAPFDALDAALNVAREVLPPPALRRLVDDLG